MSILYRELIVSKLMSIYLSNFAAAKYGGGLHFKKIVWYDSQAAADAVRGTEENFLMIF